METPIYFYLFLLLASLGLIGAGDPHCPAVRAVARCVGAAAGEADSGADRVRHTEYAQNPLGSSMTLTADPGGESRRRRRLGDVLHCFTKTVTPDFHLGWIPAGRFAQQLARLKAVSSLTESRLLSETLGHFLESGGYDHHLRSLRRRLCLTAGRGAWHYRPPFPARHAAQLLVKDAHGVRPAFTGGSQQARVHNAPQSGAPAT